MVSPARGDIWWVRLDPTSGSEIAKTRPCIVVSNNVLNRKRRTVVVVPVSSSPEADGVIKIPIICLGKNGVAVVDQIRAAAKERFGSRAGALSAAELATLSHAISEALEL